MFVKKYLLEGIGSFFLVLCFVMTANNGAGSLAPLAVGATLMVMIYAGESVSGAHFNPAVSLAALLRGTLGRVEFPYYLLSQVVGSGVAALVGVFLLGCGNAGVTNIQMRVNDPICALLAEFLGAFALAFVALGATSPHTVAGQSNSGLATGFTLAAMLYSLGSISGGAFNPAAGIGMCMAGMAAWSDSWTYLIGPCLGAAAGATVFQIIYGER